MGTSVQRALIATLLAAGVFYAPLVYADEDTGTSTQEGIESSPDELASSTEPILELFSATEAAEESASSTEEAADPLPAGVLLDRSYADTDWNIQIYGGGHYMYFFEGYESLGNPPVTQGHAWVVPNDIYKARIKTTPGTSCDEFRWGGTYGLSVWTEGFSTSYDSNPWYTRSVGDGLCEFAFYQAIPAGTRISAVSVGLSIQASIVGSAENAGTSTTGFYGDPVRGGFAFQLCGSDGCSGGFGSSTPPGPKISNVLFLPGIEGSRLYNASGKLWEPTFPFGNDNVMSLSMGDASDASIHTRTGDIIEDVTLGPIQLVQVYSPLISTLNSLQASSTFDGGNFKWQSGPYDWRLSLQDIVYNGTETDGNISYLNATDSPYLEQTLRALAASSSTGKVTIIAHSNGGLVAKALMQKLGDAETAHLIDKVIFVAVPQSGAPEAVGQLLLGYDAGIPEKIHLFAKPYVVRSFAQNIPMAYHLLPSETYFSDLLDQSHPVVSFKGEHQFGKELARYGTYIDNWSELSDYVLAKDGGRTSPYVEDLTSPEIGNESLLTYAKDIHDQIDSWRPPASVQVYQIAGWGVDTVAGVDFYEQEQRLFGFLPNGYKKEYRPNITEDGDKIVPVASALMIPVSENVKSYWVDLKSFNKKHPSKDHGSIMGVPSLLSLITNIFSNQTDSLPSLVNDRQPVSTDESKKLHFFVHSPVSLDLYDADGNHVGLNAENTTDTEVPESIYGEFGEVKFITVPSSGTYTLVLKGQSNGSFSLDIQEEENTSLRTTTFADVPVSEGTIASLKINSGDLYSSLLSVDGDGDTAIDFSLKPTAGEVVHYIPETLPSEMKRFTRHTGIVLGTTTSTESLKSFLPESVGPQVGSYLPIHISEAKPKVNQTEIKTATYAPTESPKATPNWLERLFTSVYNFVRNVLNNLLLLTAR